MSWNLDYRYAVLCLHDVNSVEALNSLLTDYASSVLKAYRETTDYPDCMDDVFGRVEEGEFSSEEEIIQAIADIVALYLDEVECTEEGVSLVVRCEEDTEYDDTDFVAELAAYLFAKSHNPYFIIHRAAYDNSGGYSHQWIGRRKNGSVLVEYLPDFLDNLWNEPAAAVFV